MGKIKYVGLTEVCVLLSFYLFILAINTRNIKFDMKPYFCMQESISLSATLYKSHYPPGNHHAATSKNVLFSGHNHLLTTGTDDLTLWL